MTNPSTPDELIAALAELRRLRPEWRLGQTLVNLASAAGRSNATAVWDLKDDEALAAAQQMIEQDGDSSTITSPSKAAKLKI